MQDLHALQSFLDQKVHQYNRPTFITDDPVAIPHGFEGLQDREITGFLVATLAWGQRKTILQSGRRLVSLMDHSPYAFLTQASEDEYRRFEGFVHRTFNATDLLYFLEVLRGHYREEESLEQAFVRHLRPEDRTVEAALSGFHAWFFRHPYAPARTRKHVATPARGSACKRLNMFLRWMVRRDEAGVDFGCWQKIRPDQLVCPLDVHVERVARILQLLHRTQTDWAAAVELTDRLRALDPQDPVKYDFALFGLGIEQYFAG